MTNRKERMHRATRELRTQAAVIGGMVAIIWLVELIDHFFMRGALDIYGVTPRSIEGLQGILLAPFLHADFAHVAANTLPLALLGWLILARGTGKFILVTLIAIIGSGLGAWWFGGPSTIHIGASGVVFGYFGYILLRALSERSLAAMSSALIVLLLYGSLIWGVLPLVAGVSWQMHLFGFLAGVAAARLLPNPPPPERERDEGILTVDYDDLYDDFELF